MAIGKYRPYLSLEECRYVHDMLIKNDAPFGIIKAFRNQIERVEHGTSSPAYVTKPSFVESLELDGPGTDVSKADYKRRQEVVYKQFKQNGRIGLNDTQLDILDDYLDRYHKEEMTDDDYDAMSARQMKKIAKGLDKDKGIQL